MGHLLKNYLIHPSGSLILNPLTGLVVESTSVLSGNVYISGNLDVAGTTTTVNSQTLVATDVNITLGNVVSPTDTTAIGGGITLLGSTNKTFEWLSVSQGWVSSENITSPTFKGNLVGDMSGTANNASYLGGVPAIDYLVINGPLGTPSSGVATNLTGTAANLNIGGTSLSSATLTTPRLIYGESFDGSANLTGIISSAFGGTGNGFTKFSGPTTSEKIFTLPNSSDTIACLGQVNTYTKTQIGNVATLSVTANIVAVDFSLSNNFSLSLQANTSQILSNPINAVAGISGQIAIIQNASPSTLTFGSSWISNDGTVLSVSTTASAVNLLTYYAVDATHIWFSISKHGIA